jgi:branched-subunit amino acid aminotransferase/4-amino-4-deoxychorismate lyase
LARPATPAPGRPVVWVDGRLVAEDAPVATARDSAYLEGRGCYTTARVRGGRPRWPERHARRLRRDAAALDLGAVDPDAVPRALAELAAGAFGAGDGIVRLQASRDAGGRVHLVGIPRPLGDDPPVWSAVIPPFAHEGPMPWGGAKVTNHLLPALARDHARASGADEAILFDAEGILVEGSRTSLFAVDAEGRLVAPDLARGGVAGLGREVVREREPALGVRAIARAELPTLRELIAVNGVRGARPIVRVGETPIGDGAPGPWSKRLSELLDLD